MNKRVNRRRIIRKIIQLITIKRKLVICRCCCWMDEQLNRNNNLVSKISDESIGGGGRVKRGGGGRRNIIEYILNLNAKDNIYIRTENISSWYTIENKKRVIYLLDAAH